MATVVGTMMIVGSPERGLFSHIRRDPDRGVAILAKAAENYDAGALQTLFLFGGGLPGDTVPPEFRAAMRGKSIPVRTLLHRAIEHGDSGNGLIAWALPGMTPFQTLQAYAIGDAVAGFYGRSDLPTIVRLSVQAEPWFERFQDWADGSGAIASSVGCSLIGGMKSRTPLPYMRNRALGIRFLQLAAARGHAASARWLAAAAGGMVAPCSVDADVYANPRR
jgi:hypothetical protein